MTNSDPRLSADICDLNEGDILPCPFCGNPPKVEMTGFHLGGRTIRCEADDCMGPHTTAACINDAVVQWNRRSVSFDRGRISGDAQGALRHLQCERCGEVAIASGTLCDSCAELSIPAAQPPAAPVEPHDPSQYCDLDACKREGCTHLADACLSRQKTVAHPRSSAGSEGEPFMMLSCREAKQCLHNIPGCICDGDPTNG